MPLDKVVLIAIAIWAFFFGLFTVTNNQWVAASAIMGYAALCTAIVCLIRAFK